MKLRLTSREGSKAGAEFGDLEFRPGAQHLEGKHDICCGTQAPAQHVSICSSPVSDQTRHSHLRIMGSPSQLLEVSDSPIRNRGCVDQNAPVQNVLDVLRGTARASPAVAIIKQISCSAGLVLDGCFWLQSRYGFGAFSLQIRCWAIKNTNVASILTGRSFGCATYLRISP